VHGRGAPCAGRFDEQLGSLRHAEWRFVPAGRSMQPLAGARHAPNSRHVAMILAITSSFPLNACSPLRSLYPGQPGFYALK